MMRKYILTVIFLSSISMLVLSCRSKTKTTIKKSDSYLVNDFEQDKDFPAGMEELQIPSGDVKIYGFIYIANGAGPHPTLVFIHGNPGNERNLDLAQNLRKVGYNVVYFDFRGSWGSKGKFTFENNIADTKAVIDYISSEQNSNRLRIDTAKIAIFGHNTGGAIGLIAGLAHPKVKGVATLSLFNPYRVIKNSEGTSNLISMKEYLATLGMLNINPDEFLMEMARNVNQYNLEELLKKSNKPVLMIDEHEANDYLKPLTVRKNIEYEVWDTDITFSNKRTALTRRLRTWADKGINPTTPVTKTE